VTTSADRSEPSSRESIFTSLFLNGPRFKGKPDRRIASRSHLSPGYPRRRRSGPANTSMLAIAPSLAPVQTPLFARLLTQPDQLQDRKTAFGGGLRSSGTWPRRSVGRAASPRTKFPLAPTACASPTRHSRSRLGRLASSSAIVGARAMVQWPRSPRSHPRVHAIQSREAVLQEIAGKLAIRPATAGCPSKPSQRRPSRVSRVRR
jgi:hypothetical protein